MHSNFYVAASEDFSAYSPVSSCMAFSKSSNPANCRMNIARSRYLSRNVGSEYIPRDLVNCRSSRKAASALPSPKCLRELERDGFITRKQYNTIPPTVEYSLAERGRTLIPALESVYQWADEQMKREEQ